VNETRGGDLAKSHPVFWLGHVTDREMPSKSWNYPVGRVAPVPSSTMWDGLVMGVDKDVGRRTRR
jgi:hypothetical protein